MLEKSGEDIDPETIVSMYVPHRKPKRIGAALLRMDKLNLVLIGMLLIVAVLFIIAFSQEKMGNFTINLNRLELYRRGISISETGEFNDATARLTASSVKDATNISIDDIPDNLDGKAGSHNGKNYMAYTYYVRNAGKEDLGYIAKSHWIHVQKALKKQCALQCGEMESVLYMLNLQKTVQQKKVA